MYSVQFAGLIHQGATTYFQIGIADEVDYTPVLFGQAITLGKPSGRIKKIL
jgi:hypothetical protein